MRKMPRCSFVVLQRGHGDPVIPGAPALVIPHYSFASNRLMDRDADLMRNICLEADARLFLSTYYSRAPGFHTVQMAYDMIPEVFRSNMETGMWYSKRKAFETAHSFIAISASTQKDLMKFYPNVTKDQISIAYPGVSGPFHPALPEELAAFKAKHRLDRPYFLMVGGRSTYKNALPALRAFAESPLWRHMHMVFAGGGPPDEQEQAIVGASLRSLGQVDDDDLRRAFSGAEALVYPSLYEGFGMPVAEALSCGCPVITGDNSSLPEVGGEGCLYVKPDSIDELRHAMRSATDPAVRQRLVALGTRHAARFTWNAMAESVKTHLEHACSDARANADPAAVRRSRARAICVGSPSSGTPEDRSAARGRYAEAAHIDADYYLPHLRLALMAEQAGDFAHAKTSCEIAVRVGKNQREALIAYHRVLTTLDESPSAIPALYEYLDHYPSDMELITLLGQAEKRRCQKLLRACDMIDAARAAEPATVSAIVATYNAEDFIEECLASLESQTIAASLEIIVVDAHSPQRERAVVEKLRRRFDNIRYIRTPEPTGVCGAWNLGVCCASGRYIALAGTHDRLSADSLQKMARVLDGDPTVVLVYGDSYTTDLPHQTFDGHVPRAPNDGVLRWPDFSYLSLLFDYSVGPHPLWRKSIHEEMGYFDTRYLAAGDQDFWLRVARTHGVAHITEITGLVHLHEDALPMRPSAPAELFAIHMKHLDDFLFQTRGELNADSLEILTRQFVAVTVNLAACGEREKAMELYATHRSRFTTTAEVLRLDGLMKKLSHGHA